MEKTIGCFTTEIQFNETRCQPHCFTHHQSITLHQSPTPTPTLHHKCLSFFTIPFYAQYGLILQKNICYKAFTIIIINL